MRKIGLLAIALILVVLLGAATLPSVKAEGFRDNSTSDTVEMFLKNPVLDPFRGPASTLYIEARGVYVRYCADDQGRPPTIIVTHLGTFEHRIEAYLSYPTINSTCYKAMSVDVLAYLGGGYPAGTHTWWINRESYTVTIP